MRRGPDVRPFDYARATSARDALELAAARPGAVFVAGGSELLSLWKDAGCAPPAVIDISRLPLDAIELRDDEVAIGALARMADVADHPVIRTDYPVIAEALLASASPQLRNAATVAGNLLQRTRCAYFRAPGFACNKRAPGSGCAARGGDDRRHAIFGASEHCAATHASDLAVALVALGSSVELRGPGGDRAVALEDLYVVPGDRPDRETTLLPGELIMAIRVPRAAVARHSRYLKVRDRAAFDFAVVSVAAALDIADGQIREARLAAGGVGTVPWRLRGSEQALAGARLDEHGLAAAAARATDGARPLGHNGFKLELLRRCVRRVVGELAGES
jgi:xanthine dehydrogenase YagS FAD-binding subunit